MLRKSWKMETRKFGRMGAMQFPTTDLKNDLCNYSARLVLTILSIFFCLFKLNIFLLLCYVLSKINGCCCCCRVFSIKTIVNKAVFN